jgi:hypothetical protein
LWAIISPKEISVGQKLERVIYPWEVGHYFYARPWIDLKFTKEVALECI